MKFGLVLPNFRSAANTRDGLVAAAQAGEVAGFDSLWASDHILVPREHESYGNVTEALMTLAFLAGITSHVKLGTSVLVLPMRNPIIAAKQFAALDYLAGGRTIAGVGVGWCEGEYEFLNADFKRRGKLMDEFVGIMRKLWTAENPIHNGTYSFGDAIFKPIPERIPPVWIGGESNAAVKRAATMGDGWQPNDRGLDEFTAKVQDLRRYSGTREVTVSIRIRVNMSDGAQAIIERLAQYREAGLEYPVVSFPHESGEELTGQVEAFGRDVIPVMSD
jgi:probable F420-dependent oxidoreductase